MDATSAAWFAGVIEQRGSFYYNGDKPVFVFQSLREDLVERIASLLPGDVSAIELEPVGWGENNTFRTAVHSKAVAPWFLDNILPHLSPLRAAEVREWAREGNDGS